MEKMLLINPPLSKLSECYFPTNLFLLKVCLEENGIETDFVDLALAAHMQKEELDQNFINLAKAYLTNLHQYDYVGISTMCNTIGISLEIAQWIKECFPKLKIIFGGPHASICYKDIVAVYKNFVDYIVVGEGEITLPLLVKTLSKLHNCITEVQGVAYFDDGVQFTGERSLLPNLNNLPFFDFQKLDLSEYYKTNATFGMEVGRGCPYSCSYCSTSVMWKRKYRVKSVDRIIEELKHISQCTNFSQVSFTHDCMTANKNFVIDLCNRIINQKIGIAWKAQSRCDTIDVEMIEKMKEAGCVGIFYGVESASQKIQRSINKNIDTEKSFNLLKSSISKMNEVVASFMIGFPEETKDDLDETIKYACRLRVAGLKKINFFKLSPLPGTRIFNAYQNEIFFDKLFPSKIVSAGHYSDGFEKEIKENKKIHSAYYSVPNQHQISNETFFLMQACLSVIVRIFPFTLLYFGCELKKSLYDLIKSFFDQISQKERETILDSMLKISTYNYEIYEAFKRYVEKLIEDKRQVCVLNYDSGLFKLQMQNDIEKLKLKIDVNSLEWIFNFKNMKLPHSMAHKESVTIELHKGASQ